MQEEKKRFLVVHQFVWAHYKAKIYSELHRQLPADMDWHVLQLSISEGSRTQIGNIDWSLHQYPVTLLFHELLENIPFWSRFWKVLRWVRTYKPHVINLPGYYDMAMNLISLYCKWTGIKVIIANDSTEDDNPKVWWKEALKRFFIQKGDGFYCYGTKSTQYAIQLGAKPSQILVANNAVDNDAIRQKFESAWPTRDHVKAMRGLRRYNFVFVGRIASMKNLLTLLEAYRSVQTADWGLLVVGSGDEEEKLKEFCRIHALTGVQFVPGVSWQDVPLYMSLGDVFVLPSFSETWGLVLNEAMVCQMPVLVSNRCGSSVDLVREGKNGFTFDPFQVEDLASKLSWCMEHVEELPQMGKASLALIQRYNPQQVAKEMIDGFYQVLHESN